MNAARVQCTSCSRRLCNACDHRIKGYPYCQDCIVFGIENLSRNYNSARYKSKARLAALCAVLPGMGAVYNRQNVKAVVHFVTVVGLFQLTGIHVLEGFFALAGFSFYLFTIIDAYRSAQAIAQGESPAIGEERFKRGLARRAPMIGLMLIATGLIAVIQFLRPFGFHLSVAGLLPVALIILGGYLLTSYFKRSRGEEYAREDTHNRPYMVIPGQVSDGGYRNLNRASRPGDFR